MNDLSLFPVINFFGPYRDTFFRFVGYKITKFKTLLLNSKT